MDINDFNLDGVGINNGNYFGMPYDESNAKLVLLSVPWDVTASYGGGASFAPDAIIEASTQIDFYDPMAPGEWRKGIATIGIDYSIQDRSSRLRGDAKKVMENLENGRVMFEEYLMPRKVERVNTGSSDLNQQVYEDSLKRLEAGKIVGLVGGDHSTPYGLIKAVAQKEENIGILHLDAHFDLRPSYEGFTYSHASIMYNVLKDIHQVEKLVQVGLRDFSEEEYNRAVNDPRISFYDDFTISNRKFEGETWKAICCNIISELPQKVYISFDIDSLSIQYCPSTGTPVAGGLSFNEAFYLINAVAESGRTIVGFDLCEVAPGQQGKWDANVGARALFKLCGITLKTNR